MKKLFVIAVIVVFTLSSCLRTPIRQYADAPTHNRAKKELKILSWNIYMLPPLIKTSFKRKRAKVIPETIEAYDYDIIVFQEAFHFGPRHVLRRRLKEKYPYHYGPANMRAASLRTNSGVWVVSKIPLELLGTIRYEDCSGIDCWGRKGGLLLQGEWQGQAFQLFGTHLESGPQQVRYKQYPQIRALLDTHKVTGVPQILCGDFNTNKAEPEHYNKMLDVLDAEDGELLNKEITLDGTMDDYKQRGPARTSSKIIDFIFYRGNGHQPFKIEREARQFESDWHKTYRGLSDHNAIEMRIAF